MVLGSLPTTVGHSFFLLPHFPLSFFQWDDLMSRRPREGEEDAELLAEIEDARKSMGQFRRRTSQAYQARKGK